MTATHARPAGRLAYLRSRERLAVDALASAERDMPLGGLKGADTRAAFYGDRLAGIREAIAVLEYPEGPGGEDAAHCTSCGLTLVAGICFAPDCGRTA